MKLTRQQLANLAHQAAYGFGLPSSDLKLRVVVLLTDEAGDWVGVGANTCAGDVETILRAALDAKGRENYG